MEEAIKETGSAMAFLPSFIESETDEGNARLVPSAGLGQVSTLEIMKDPSEKNSWIYSEMKPMSMPADVDDGKILPISTSFPTTFTNMFPSPSPLEIADSKEGSLVEYGVVSSEMKPIKAYLSGRGGRQRRGRKSAVVVRDVTQCDMSKICPPSSSRGSESSTCDTSKQMSPSDPKKPKTPSSTPRLKKPKLYESDGPEARNARAAKANRERQKEKKIQMEKDLARLRQEIALQNEKILVLEAEVEKRRAEEGLRIATTTAGDFLEGIMRKVQSHFGPLQIEIASWFYQVPIFAEQVKSALRHDENLPKANFAIANQPAMSTSLIMHWDPVGRKGRINYDPNQPRPTDYKPIS